MATNGIEAEVATASAISTRLSSPSHSTIAQSPVTEAISSLDERLVVSSHSNQQVASFQHDLSAPVASATSHHNASDKSPDIQHSSASKRSGNQQDLGIREKSMAAGASAVLSAVIMNPLDVVKVGISTRLWG